MDRGQCGVCRLVGSPSSFAGNRRHCLLRERDVRQLAEASFHLLDQSFPRGDDGLEVTEVVAFEIVDSFADFLGKP